MLLTRRGTGGVSGLVHDQVDRPGNLCADRRQRQFDTGHQGHDLEPREQVARRIGMRRGQRTFMAGIHGLQHIERFTAAAFADDDAIGTHAQRIAYQIANA